MKYKVAGFVHTIHINIPFIVLQVPEYLLRIANLRGYSYFFINEELL